MVLEYTRSVGVPWDEAGSTHTASLSCKVKHQGHCSACKLDGDQTAAEPGRPAWATSQHESLESEGNRPVPPETLTVLANDTICTFKNNLEFWKTCTDHQEPGSFLLLQSVSEEVTGETDKWSFPNFRVLHNEIRQLPECLSSSVIEMFPRDQRWTPQNRAGLEDPSTPLGLKVTLPASEATP